MSKESAVVLKLVPLEKIIIESNRRYTKEDGFEQLKSSIEKVGIIQPPLLRCEGKDYLVIAGRRRLEAALSLGKKEEYCLVYPEDDPRDDDEIALTENVNRQEMHPLDEALLFKSRADKGMNVNEIAQYYARSPAAIYKRLRLCGLIAELKDLFRDGRFDIADAALLAELPQDDQTEFYEQHKSIADMGDNTKIHCNDITTFIFQKQKFRIYECMQCENCEKRTHNKGNELFEEYDYLSDVCLYSECYLSKWQAMIAKELETQTIQLTEAGVLTDDKIYFSDGVPKQIYEKASFVMFPGCSKYAVMKRKDYDFSGETNRKKDACWEIKTDYKGVLSVRRIGYSERIKMPAREKPAAGEDGGNGTGKTNEAMLIEKYGKEILAAVAEDRGTQPLEIAETINKKCQFAGRFEGEIEDEIYRRIISRNVALEESTETSGIMQVNYMSIFLELINEDIYMSGSLIEKEFNKEQKEMYKELVADPVVEILASIPKNVQKLFHFYLIFNDEFRRTVPGKDCFDKRANIDNNLFLKYAGMNREEYKKFYLEVAKEVANKILGDKKKSELIKADKKAAASHGGDTPKEASGGNKPAKKKGKKAKAIKKKDDEQRCRKCGCTHFTPCIDPNEGPCYWVEDDLCSNCATPEEIEAAMENSPFDPDGDLDIDMDGDDE